MGEQKSAAKFSLETTNYQSRQPMAPTQDLQMQETDLSSEGESFLSAFTTENPAPKYKKHDKPNTLIQRAARLELESITLKQAMDDAVRKLQELSITNITTLVQQVSQIQQDLEVLKSANKLDQQTIERATIEFANIRNTLVTYCNQCHDQSNNVVDEMRGIRLSIDDQLTKMLIIVGNTQMLLNHFSLNQQSIEEKLDQQRLNYENLQKQIMTQNKDVLEIKQFLQLLVPRVISIEANYKLLINNNKTPSTANKLSKSMPKKASSKKRQLM